MPPVNTLLKERYLLAEEIGRGGMGAVYRATDKTFDSTVAIKETFYRDDHLRKAFEREARLLNRLRHAALPVVFDYFFEGDGQFLVMQFIPGNDLGGMLDKRKNKVEPIGKPKPFTLDEVLPWVEQLLDALDYLHTQTPPVIHRDIKPQNLKLTQRGEIILLDFGLAKGAATQMHATSSGSIFGYTPNYAPLEQIHGAGTDARSDLYSLAATVYHLLTGETPLGALTRATATVSGRPDPLVAVQKVNPQIPENLAAILMRALSQNPNERPQNAAEMLRVWRIAKQYAHSRTADVTGETKPEQSAEVMRPTLAYHSEKTSDTQAPIAATQQQGAEEITRKRPPKTKSEKTPEPTDAKPVAETKPKAAKAEKKVDLSPRRQEILTLLAQERSDAEIARQLGVETKALSDYVTKLRHDIGVITRKDLVIWAMTQVKTAREPQAQKTEPPKKSTKSPADNTQKKTDKATAAKIIDVIEQSKGKADEAKRPMDFLQAQQRQRLLEFLVQGLSDEEIARKLHIQPFVVKHHLSDLQLEAGVITRKDLILWAMQRGIKAPVEVRPVTPAQSKFSSGQAAAGSVSATAAAKTSDEQPEKKETIFGNFLQAIGFGFFAFVMWGGVYYFGENYKSGGNAIGNNAGAVIAFILGSIFALAALGSIVTMFQLIMKKK